MLNAQSTHWWFAHMNGMLGGCIAALTAFFVVNADSLGAAPLVAWLSPSVVGTVAVALWTRHDRNMFGGDGHLTRSTSTYLSTSAR